MSSQVKRCQTFAFTPLLLAAGVWLEMGDHLGHFMDVKLLKLHTILVNSKADVTRDDLQRRFLAIRVVNI